MKLKALLLGLAIAASQTGYSMDGIQEPENAACKLVKKFVTITQANDSIEAITNALAEILKQKAKGPSAVTWISEQESSSEMRALIESTNTIFNDGFIRFFEAMEAMDVSAITTAVEDSQDELIEIFKQDILTCNTNYYFLIEKTSKDFFEVAVALDA